MGQYERSQYRSTHLQATRLRLPCHAHTYPGPAYLIPHTGPTYRKPQRGALAADAVPRSGHPLRRALLSVSCSASCFVLHTSAADHHRATSPRAAWRERAPTTPRSWILWVAAATTLAPTATLWPFRCTGYDNDKASPCGGWARKNTNFRAAPDGCYYFRCIIGERSGDRKESECTIRIRSLPTGSPATSSMCMNHLSGLPRLRWLSVLWHGGVVRARWGWRRR
mmetsp:Transcript_45161/g.113057  ORF Transcript_45161/g.113057 Transcript_45161/m.113057 type:complete len:224 (-) Transcript_45161:160-831(-)